jgi:SAM-dependent methyltransferase
MSATQARTQKRTKTDRKSPKASGASARVEGGRVVRKGAPKKKSAKKAAKKRKTRYTAKTADKHELYQKAVQSPEEDVKFLSRVYRTLRRKKALHFREDFCGTGLLSSHWVRQSKKHTAEGFDIDPDPVAWGLAHHFEELGEAAERYTVHLKDVREPSRKRPDVRCAQNFSYCVFHTRAEMLAYFRAVCADLADDGVFVLDLHGGPESTEEMEEVRDCGGFDYVWDQDEFWPGTGEYNCYIHFRFPDGTELKRAFSYRWRMWYLTELKDILADAGFSRVTAYFEGTDENGEDGNGIFRKGVRGENCESWIAYLAAEK